MTALDDNLKFCTTRETPCESEACGGDCKARANLTHAERSSHAGQRLHAHDICHSLPGRRRDEEVDRMHVSRVLFAATVTDAVGPAPSCSPSGTKAR
jgi:hypothetical protein